MAGLNSMNKDCETLHNYLVERLGHKWRLSTWKQKYAARIAKYGLEDCLTAVDGFCSRIWHVENYSHNAPDLIFRSDKQLEKFLVAGRKLNRTRDEEVEHQRRSEDLKASQAATRDKLSKTNLKAQKRLKELLAPLKEEVTSISWKVWFEPLLYAGKKSDTILLFHENAAWIEEHYGQMITKALNRPVMFVNKVD